jgi:hypothetical protein
MMETHAQTQPHEYPACRTLSHTLQSTHTYYRLVSDGTCCSPAPIADAPAAPMLLPAILHTAQPPQHTAQHTEVHTPTTTTACSGRTATKYHLCTPHTTKAPSHKLHNTSTTPCSSLLINSFHSSPHTQHAQPLHVKPITTHSRTAPLIPYTACLTPHTLSSTHTYFRLVSDGTCRSSAAIAAAPSSPISLPLTLHTAQPPQHTAQPTDTPQQGPQHAAAAPRSSTTSAHFAANESYHTHITTHMHLSLTHPHHARLLISLLPSTYSHTRHAQPLHATHINIQPHTTLPFTHTYLSLVSDGTWRSPAAIAAAPSSPMLFHPTLHTAQPPQHIRQHAELNTPQAVYAMCPCVRVGERG